MKRISCCKFSLSRISKFKDFTEKKKPWFFQSQKKTSTRNWRKCDQLGEWRFCFCVFFKGLGASATSSLFVAPYFEKKYIYISILWIFLFHNETTFEAWGRSSETNPLLPSQGPSRICPGSGPTHQVENGGAWIIFFKSWKHVSWKVRILESLGNKHIFQVIQELIKVFWGNLGPFWVRKKWLSVRNHDSVKFACVSQSRYGKIQAVTYYWGKPAFILVNH